MTAVNKSYGGKEPERDELEAYTLSLDELATMFRTDLVKGLSKKEAEERLRVYGSNVVPKVKAGLFSEYVAPFLNWLINVYLIASAALAVVAYFLVPEIWKRVAFWLYIVAVNVLVTIVQQARANKKLDALEGLSAPKCKAVRDGELVEILSKFVVPGDIIRLGHGDMIPADARIISASGFRVNEASLTGESEEIEKSQGEMQVKECTSPSNIKNSVFLGTYVTAGIASIMATKTGKHTELGKIATRLKKISTREILLRKKVNKIAKYLALAVLFYLGAVFLTKIIQDLFIEGFGTALKLQLVAIEAAYYIMTAMTIMPINIPLLTTVVLVTGVFAMARHRVIIRNLNAVESLGRVSVVCSDKTGTITKGEMTVKWIFLPSSKMKSALYGVTGVGYEPHGKIKKIDSSIGLETLIEKEPEVLDGSEAEIKDSKQLESLFVSGLLNNDSSVVEEKVKTEDLAERTVYKTSGNFTDVSILVMSRKSNIEEAFYKSNFQEVYNYPFESKMQRMTKVFKHSGRYVVFTKGATSAILPLCDFIAEDGMKEADTLDGEDREFINSKAYLFSSSGFRIISFAYKYLDELPSEAKNEREFLENNLTYLGFVAIIDPPREGVLESVLEARSAGVKTVMITGDSVETGKSIAKEMGILEEGGLSTEGYDIKSLPDDEFLKTSVFARVSPEHKLDIIDRYKKGNHVVAMTGEGVNDVLAISKADVGIAMGITGTDMTKEASDMIITDDSFNSIVTGIREGRGIFKKIQSIIFFYIAVNLAEALIFFGSSFILGYHPLTLWQQLLIVFTTHSIPPLALIIDSLDKDVMKETPRGTEDIFTKRMTISLLLFSMSLALAVYAAYFGTLSGTIPVYDGNKAGFALNIGDIYLLSSVSWVEAKARTLIYAVLVVAECTLVISLRRMNKPMSRILKEDNHWIVWMFILLVPAALLVLMYIPDTQLILTLYADINFDIIQLTLIDWVFVISLGAIPIILLEFYKKYLLVKHA